ncbi:hypothetical protein METHB2_240033 [Candidatus Methylobacter favarea]|uniref:Uncharacterized protein n=1 Tax=Candidatus Methylobacter favarea TaxID=2707345 RepID=A0A8S0X803_9GAMM|nr:hypothetical protein METHB2_240033 [Candidatus Methylobacter favarea]
MTIVLSRILAGATILHDAAV